jgi:hypothetical protein
VLDLLEWCRSLGPRQIFEQFGRPGGVGAAMPVSDHAAQHLPVQKEIIGTRRELNEAIGHAGPEIGLFVRKGARTCYNRTDAMSASLTFTVWHLQERRCRRLDGHGSRAERLTVGAGPECWQLAGNVGSDR